MASTKITYSYLGNSGVKVSNVCLGTTTFGPHHGPLECEEDLCYKLLDRYAELGGNFIDTANIYKKGKSEEILGNWLSKQDRKKYVIATKVRFTMEEGDPNSVGLSRLHIMQAIDESLRRLQTDYVDLYQVIPPVYQNPTRIKLTPDGSPGKPKMLSQYSSA